MDERVNPALFTQPEEVALYADLVEAKRRAKELLEREDYLGYFKMLTKVFLKTR